MIAILSAFNEEDVIAQVVGDYLAQGVSVYVLDDGSTDGTVEALEPLRGRGLIAVERLPPLLDAGGRPVMSWTRILKRKEELSRELAGDWFLHADADELRESPWQERTLAEAIDLVDQLGFNAINFAVFNFWPVGDGELPRGGDLRQHFTHYAPPERFDRVQIKAWKRSTMPVDLVTDGGHEARFPGRRVFPLRFLLRHYSIRGQAQGYRKIFEERKARFLPEERARDWHRQYDRFEPGDSLMRDPSTLIRFDPALARAELHLQSIEEAEQAPDALGRQLANALEARETIGDEYAAFVASRKELDREAERLSREYQTMTRSRDGLARQLTELHQAHAAAVASRHELGGENHRLGVAYGAMVANRDQQAREVERLSREYAAMTASRDELARAVDRVHRELSAASVRWSGEQAALVVERERIAHEAERLSREYAVMTASRDELARAVHRVHRELSAASERWSGEQSALAAERERLVRENQRLDREQAAVVADRDRQAQEAARLGLEYQAMSHSRDELAQVAEEPGRRHDALVHERDALTRERDRLTRDLDALAEDRDALAREHEALLEDRDALVRDRDVLAADRDERAREASRLSREYAALWADRDRLQAHADQRQAHADQRQAHADQLQARADQLQAHVDQLQAHVDRLQAELGAGARQIAGLRAELDAGTISRRLQAVRAQVGSVVGPWLARLKERAIPAPTGAPAGAGAAVDDLDQAYAEWIRETAPSDVELARLRDSVAGAAHQPTISVLMTRSSDDDPSLAKARAMLARQSYSRWELCPVDGSRSEASGGVAAALNQALALTTGELVTWADADDEIDPHAFAEMVRALSDREIDIVYSDEDRLSPAGQRCAPFFKPDWSPDLLESRSYLGQLTVIRRALLDEVGGFRPGFDGAHDYDLLLRATEKARRVHHLPKVLYHRRTLARVSDEGSRRALRAALERRGERGDVASTSDRPGWYRTRRVVEGDPRVTIIIPTRDQAELLEACLDSLADTSYQAFDILIMDNGSVAAPTRRLLGRLRRRGVRVVRDEQPFNFSQLNNSAVALTATPFVLFLNDDTRVVEPDWLTAMLEHAQRREVGAVGARLLHEDGSLQHGGVALGCGGGSDVLGGIAAHLRRGQALAHLDSARATRNLSAVTAACLLMRRTVFDEVGGFDAALPVTYNDVDLCLKIRRCGLRVVYTPWATLIHHESATRGPGGGSDEPRRMIEKWGPELLADPYYSPNLSLAAEHAGLRFRAERDRVAAELERRLEARRNAASRSAPRLLP